MPDQWFMDPENHPLIADADTRTAVRLGTQRCIDDYARVDALPGDQQVWAGPLLKQCAAIAETVLEQIDEAEQKGGAVVDFQKPQTTIAKWVRAHQQIHDACKAHGVVGLSWPPVVIQPAG